MRMPKSYHAHTYYKTKIPTYNMQLGFLPKRDSIKCLEYYSTKKAVATPPKQDYMHMCWYE